MLGYIIALVMNLATHNGMELKQKWENILNAIRVEKPNSEVACGFQGFSRCFSTSNATPRTFSCLEYGN